MFEYLLDGNSAAVSIISHNFTQKVQFIPEIQKKISKTTGILIPANS